MTGLANTITWLDHLPPVTFDVTITVAPSTGRVYYGATSSNITDMP
jgi:hypothetical protein